MLCLRAVRLGAPCTAGHGDYMLSVVFIIVIIVVLVIVIVIVVVDSILISINPPCKSDRWSPRIVVVLKERVGGSAPLQTKPSFDSVRIGAPLLDRRELAALPPRQCQWRRRRRLDLLRRLLRRYLG